MNDVESRRSAAYDLLPEVGHLPGSRRWRERGLQGLVAVLTLGLLLAAGGGVWYQRWWTREVGPQQHVAATALTSVQESSWRSAATVDDRASAGTGRAPIVLAYHDIAARRTGSTYVVTARHFAQQMRMLREAGYHTLTGSQFVAYLKGTYTPSSNSVVITFDDGTRGLYTYADKILQANGFSAISFLISGRVGTRAPYYLTWAQVKRMQRSGRWSFGGHTHDTHTQSASAAGATLSSALTSPRTDTHGVTETFREFKARIARDQRLELRDFSEHGLPRPALFAWPFSEVEGEGQGTPYANYVFGLVKRLYVASLVNSAVPRPVPTSVSDQLPIGRQEVLAATTTDQLFTEVRRMQSLPLTTARPAATDAWVEPWSSSVVALRATAGGLVLAGRRTTALPVDWRPQQTGAWTGYRVSATLTGLQHGRIGVRARVGSVDQVTVSASHGSVRVERIDRLVPDAEPVGTDYDVHTGDDVSVSVEVRADATVVTFGSHRIVLALRRGADVTGGIGIYVGAHGTASPAVRDLLVTPLA